MKNENYLRPFWYTNPNETPSMQCRISILRRGKTEMKMEVTRFVSMSVFVLSLTSAVTWQRINFSSAFNLLPSDANPPTYLKYKL